MSRPKVPSLPATLIHPAHPSHVIPTEERNRAERHVVLRSTRCGDQPDQAPGTERDEDQRADDVDQRDDYLPANGAAARINDRQGFVLARLQSRVSTVAATGGVAASDVPAALLALGAVASGLTTGVITVTAEPVGTAVASCATSGGAGPAALTARAHAKVSANRMAPMKGDTPLRQ